MSSAYVASNKGSSTVAVGFNATATSITVATGEGDRFPSPSGGDYTLVTLQNTAGVREIVCIVGRTADVLTVGIPGSAAANVAGRNYETIYGMAAAAWVLGDVVSCRPTAAIMVLGANAVTLTGTQTLTKKTLTAPALGTPVSGVLTNCTGYPVFPAGTAVVFMQTAAPTGWTKSTTHNDKALRVVSGAASSGGATAFSSVFGAGKTTGSTAADLAAHTHTGPSHTHTGTTGTQSANHTHTATTDATNNAAANKDSGVLGLGTELSVTPTAASGITTSTESATHTHSFTTAADGTGATGSTGAGGGHTHTESLDLQYVDVIVATKD